MKILITTNLIICSIAALLTWYVLAPYLDSKGFFTGIRYNNSYACSDWVEKDYDNQISYNIHIHKTGCWIGQVLGVEK